MSRLMDILLCEKCIKGDNGRIVKSLVTASQKCISRLVVPNFYKSLLLVVKQSRISSNHLLCSGLAVLSVWMLHRQAVYCRLFNSSVFCEAVIQTTSWCYIRMAWLTDAFYQCRFVDTYYQTLVYFSSLFNRLAEDSMRWVHEQHRCVKSAIDDNWITLPCRELANFSSCNEFFWWSFT